MKIALCLYGVVGSSKGKSHLGSSIEVLSIGHKKYYENILKDNDVDIFIHSWSKDIESEILKLYKPTSYIIEDQEQFDIPDYIKGNNAKEPKRVEFVFSRWRSTQKVLNLKIAHEKENNFEYDLCLLSRYNIAFEKKMNFKKVRKDKLNFSNWYGVQYDQVADIFRDGRGIFYKLREKTNIDNLKKFGRGYPYDGEGLLDYWILSDKKINTFAEIFDKLPEYFQPGNCPGSPYVSNHKVLLHHVKTVDYLKDINFILDPTKDHSMIRWKYFNSKE